MGLLSIFKRQDDSAAAPAPDAVAQARTRARRRLIGATLLLALGVIGFPLLFESQPRPIPVDIPIEIPRKETAPPLVLPPAAAVPGAASVAVAVAAAPLAPLRPTQPPAPVPAQAPPSAAKPAVAAPVLVAPVVAEPAPSAPRSAAASSRPDVTSRVDDGQRAQALLEGRAQASSAAVAARPSDDNAGLRLVVQVGAYTEADKLKEARQKVEKLGLKTYTQVVESDGGRRTRVRVGPFATRAEADKAAAQIRGQGLPAAILSL